MMANQLMNWHAKMDLMELFKNGCILQQGLKEQRAMMASQLMNWHAKMDLMELLMNGY